MFCRKKKSQLSDNTSPRPPTLSHCPRHDAPLRNSALFIRGRTFHFYFHFYLLGLCFLKNWTHLCGCIDYPSHHPYTQGRKLPLFICLECSQYPPESVTVFSIPSSKSAKPFFIWSLVLKVRYQLFLSPPLRTDSTHLPGQADLSDAAEQNHQVHGISDFQSLQLCLQPPRGLSPAPAVQDSTPGGNQVGFPDAKEWEENGWRDATVSSFTRWQFIEVWR